MNTKPRWDISHHPAHQDDAVSTVVGVILIVFLVVALTAIIYSLIFGLVSTVEKTAYVVTDSEIINITPGVSGIVIIHRNGDSMYYENQSQDAPYEVRFMVDIGDESSLVKSDPALLSSDTTWSPGDRVIIFKRDDGFYLSNDPALITGAVPFPADSAKIRIIDNTHHQLIAYQGAGTTGKTGPTEIPTTLPTVTQTTAPTTVPSTEPTTIPTTIPTSVPTTTETTIPTTEPTTPPTTTPTTVPTTFPTSIPTTVPTPSQTCVNCKAGEGFSVSFTTEIRGPLMIRFKDDSSPQPNTRIWSFGDGDSASGELIDHTYPAAGSYLVTLTVKKNNSPCTCTLSRSITVG